MRGIMVEFSFPAIRIRNDNRIQPALQCLFFCWMPLRERYRNSSAIFPSIQFGNPPSGPLLHFPKLPACINRLHSVIVAIANKVQSEE